MIRAGTMVRLAAGQKHGQEFPKNASHSPFDEHFLRRYFTLLDCAAGTQSCANQFGRRKGRKTCDLGSTIARRSPFGGIRKGTVFPDSSSEAILRMRRVCCRICCMLRRQRLLAPDTKGNEGSNLNLSAS